MHSITLVGRSLKDAVGFHANFSRSVQVPTLTDSETFVALPLVVASASIGSFSSSLAGFVLMFGTQNETDGAGSCVSVRYRGSGRTATSTVLAGAATREVGCFAGGFLLCGEPNAKNSASVARAGIFFLSLV